MAEAGAGSNAPGHAAADGDGASAERVSVLLCGPAGMIRGLQAGFRKLGVPGRHIYGEYFDLR